MISVGFAPELLADEAELVLSEHEVLICIDLLHGHLILHSPVDVETRDSRLVLQDVPHHPLDQHLFRVVLQQFLLDIVIVHVVAHPEEFLVQGWHWKDDGSDPEQVLLRGNLAVVGGIGLDLKLHDAFVQGAHGEGVEDLVIFFIFGWADINEFPVDFIGDGFECFEGDAELDRGIERGRVVDYLYIRDVDYWHIV